MSKLDAGQDLLNHQWQHLYAPGILLVAGNRICVLAFRKSRRTVGGAGRQAWIGKGNLYLLDAATLCPASVLGYQHLLLHPEMGQGHWIRAK